MDRESVRVELLQEGNHLLDERVSLAPLREPGSGASFVADRPTEVARYRLDLDDAAATPVECPHGRLRWHGWASVDADVEDGRSPVRTPGTEKRFEVHRQELVDSEDFSSDYCPDP